MKILKLPFFAFLILSISIFIISGCEREVTYKIKEGLFNFNKPVTLGLEEINGIRTSTIYSPKLETDNKYNHAVVLYPFNDYLYAQWQSSIKDEDAEDTVVLYSRSKDGVNWNKPDTLAPTWEKGIYTSGGWWSYKDTLIAYINVWPKQPNLPKGGYVIYKESTDGVTWSEAKRLLNNNNNFVNGIIEQDPHSLPIGRILTAVHEQPGLICTPYYTDDLRGVKGWTKGEMKNLPYKNGISRELEPSSFYKSDGSVVMVFRDQASSFKQLASVSYDNCETWSEPIITNMPDSRAKQSAGNLPNGTAFIINNPSGNKSRFPLVITLSKDGNFFDKAFLIRAGGVDLPRMKFEGKYKRVGYSYPKSIVWKDNLYVSYATNKENIEVTRIPISELNY